jgi:hypothetical protein
LFAVRSGERSFQGRVNQTKNLNPKDPRVVDSQGFYYMSNQKDFNWENFETKGFGEGYSKDERAEMEKLYDKTLNEITEKEVIKGTVVGINDKDVIINIGFKSDGLGSFK